MSEDTPELPAGLRSVAGLDLKPALEAVLMVVDEPATEEHLAKILEQPQRLRLVRPKAVEVDQDCANSGIVH